ncbi:diguanylate cyclase (GGDEF)-like protein [Kineococcus radiotolerans]|uniref:Diguanylate cyclase (GGDEF)-like protein n=1 Tax=Kineococcus radiotolerans TaxID=131568 RepID=A0A7W4TK41_KINRA|nr:GGDEF domain-containing phosphodiesterase [Kineococcus radiotolerans]MBB2900368.1 diguanylate cyclase (GGDEF)-like protein [Kineococcus radiotolerans]
MTTRTQRRVDRTVDVGTVVLLLAVFTTCLAPVGDGVRSVVLAASGVVGLLGLVVGAVVHRPRPRWAWWAMALSGFVFLAGLGVRAWTAGRDDVPARLGDVFSLTGFTLLLLALGALLRAHRGLRREVVCDVLVLTCAGALASLRLLVLPALERAGADPAAIVLAGVYPMVDVVILGIVADLLISAPRRPSNRLLFGAVLALLVGDTWFGVAEAAGAVLPPAAAQGFYAVGYLCLGAAAVHPSQSRRRAPAPDAGPSPRGDGDAWSPPRLVTLTVSMAAVVVLVTWPTTTHPRLHGLASASTLAVTFGLLVFRAVSAVDGQARARAVLERRTRHDSLTDLANREEVDRLVDGLRARPVPAGSDRWVLFCDLDGFKRVNDRWGHGAGDELLRTTAGRLRAVAGTAVVGRLSGDEFVLATVGTATEVEDLARAVLDAVGRPAQLPGAEVVVTASVGLARVLTGAEDALRDADAAMYRAKAQGRNRWALFDESMRSDAGDVLDLEVALRHAVDADAFEVVYQPVVDVADGRPRGVEALVRWNRPGVGPVSPVVFVPVLEDAGLIVAVGRSVLDRALAQLAEWRRAGAVDQAFTVSVNVSPRQLFDPALPDDLARLLHAHRVPGRCVVLELTESSMLEGDEATLDVLHRLRGLGVGLAVDDFGTGYSALSYLRDFPVTRVKIDRSFVNGIGRSARDEEVVRAVVAVSHALGLGITAEGVETAAQRDVLHGMGVTHGQGWLWSAALPPGELEPLLRLGVPSPGADGADAGDPSPDLRVGSA